MRLIKEVAPWRAVGLVLALFWSLPAVGSDTIRLTPADPQPAAGSLQPGFAVKYAYPGDIKTLHQAESWRDHGPKPGPAIIGFDYPDTLPGENVMTSESSEYVIAFIDGYISFAEPGTHYLEFWSNDGLRVEIGGTQVYEHDGRHPCESLGPQAVEVPEAGWYEVKALFFQRRGTSCLLLKTKPPQGVLDWAPLEIYAHVPE